ncbi:MAG TPA: hypothetical protein VG123_28440, partial [Streptosporangiaceae bacterium]|nr:hypothetical protein [Streptosporangiaceae bacterium]
KVGDTTASGACLDGLIATGNHESAAAVCLSGATINGGLSLRGAHIANSKGPALAAEGITVQGDLLMTGADRLMTVADRPFAAEGTGGHGTIRLHRASVSGQLSLERAVVIYAAPAGDLAGAVCLSGATISGNLVLRNATMVADAGPALMAENLTVKGHAGYCEEPAERFTALAKSEAGAVCLPGAAITGQLSLCGAFLENDCGPALMAELAVIQEDAVLTQGFIAKGAGPHGALCLREAKISGDLALHGACLDNGSGPALGADGLSVQGDLMMTRDASRNLPFVATGTGRRGTIRLLRASIAGQLSLERAVVANGVPADPSGGPGPAAAAGTQRGAVCLSGAAISGNLVLRRAVLISAAGPALMGDYLTVKGDAALCEAAGEGFYAAGQGDLGAVCLAGATVSGQLSLCGSTMVNDQGPALSAESAQVQGDAFLAGGFTAVGAGQYGTVRLVDASFARELCCSGVFGQPEEKEAGTTWPALDLRRAKVGTLRFDGFRAFNRGPLRGLLAFDGLTYTGLPLLGDLETLWPRTNERSRGRGWRAEDETKNVGQWTFWFRDCAGTFATQPYQALAAAYESRGYDNLARRVMVRQGDAMRARGSLTPVRRASQFFSKWLIGYGYHCVAALAWLAGLFAVTAAAAVFLLGPHHYIVQVSASTSTSAPASAHPAKAGYPRCSVAGDINYAIGLALPIISLSNSQTACDIRPPGDWEMNLLGWVVRVLAAVLAVVYAAGLTGLNRSLPSGGS